jgi:hypothetical protein
MVELAERSSFAREARFLLGSNAGFGGDDLERDGQAGLEVERSKDHTGAAAANLAFDGEAAADPPSFGHIESHVETH